ncbi:hypothetical protein EV645_8300 [Kribbella rubisoli]|uniref:MYXO-CTERM domain-containing protein n=2 Tax=Kribbella TaxID=182639 RepID=A0A4R8A463_9ACTN|nr:MULTISPECIES: hypothetical protein [Kribbella]RZU01468.1 hypothetical protein EV645_8300 [Kribbella rubisoli]TDW23040.1 hypothetical protein EV650_1890 [Kribbella kalugense]
MKHICTFIAVPVVACGFAVAGAVQASAYPIDPEDDYRTPVVVVHDPGATIQVDDAVTEAVQAGASAIGGAGIALAVLWAYRRRHPAQVH